MSQPSFQSIRDELVFMDDVFKGVLPTIVAGMPATSTNVEGQMMRAVEAAYDLAEKAVRSRRVRHAQAMAVQQQHTEARRIA